MKLSLKHALIIGSAASAAVITLAAMGAAKQRPENETPSVLERKVSNFSGRGTFEVLVARLAVQLMPQGVIGLESTSLLPEKEIEISLDAPATVRAILTQMCEADGEHRAILAHDRRIVNVILNKPNRLTKILNTNVGQFDTSIDAWAPNWYAYITQSSPDIYNTVEQYYKQQPIIKSPSGAGANMETNLLPPHLEIHLKNATVFEILNAISAKELDWAAKESTPVLPLMVTPRAFPFGWRARLQPPSDLPINVLISSVFTAFPSPGHPFPIK